MENPSTTSSESLTATLTNTTHALGRGFDVTNDFRLLYCKGSRLLHQEHAKKDLIVSDGVVVPNVHADIGIITCTTENSHVKKLPVCTFHEMAKYFNEKSGLTGEIPNGSFNSMFNFSGSYTVDAAATKSLAIVGYFIPLFEVILTVRI